MLTAVVSTLETRLNGPLCIPLSGYRLQLPESSVRFEVKSA